MKRWIKCTVLMMLLILSGNPVFAQENYASNISRSSDDEKLVITYDIIPADGTRSFSVILFIAYEGKQVKPSSAYGDVGVNIEPGTGKAIVWYYKNDFDGNIENVTAEVYAYKENEPQAIFSIGSLSNNGYAPCEVAFINNSSYANEFEWNFGDPASGVRNLSFEKDPRHVYDNGGIYSISLTARNTQLRLENVYYQSIEVKKHEPVTADFQIDGNNQLAPASVEFTNASVNGDVFHWNFGDPSSGRKNESTKKDGKFKYKNPGTYQVQLIAKNNFSGLSDTLVKEVVVEQEKTAEAGFIYTKSSDTAPSVVTFKNTSTSADRYEWNFGDPSSGEKNESAEADPTHLYSAPGSYEVKLSAWAKGTKKPSTFSEVITVNELPQPPEARFTIQNNNVIGPVTILFSNNSLNATKFLWDFGDPESGDDNTSDRMNPSHTYKKAGRYQVVLTASSPGFTRASTATDQVVITGPSTPQVKPEARFSIENNGVPAPAVINFTDHSQYADSYQWDFGNPDSGDNTSDLKNPVHTYVREGKYKVTLTIKNENTGQTDTFTDYVNITGAEKPAVSPVAGFTFEMKDNLTAPAKVVFSNASENADSYTWDFGDPGSGSRNSSTLQNPEHVFDQAGEYKVMLKVVNRESGKEAMTEKIVVVKKPMLPPMADFEFILQSESVPAEIEFKNLSGNADSYKWNFGDTGSDNNESSEKNPSYNYKIPGTYHVTLEAKNTATGEVHQTAKKITVRSNYGTFIKSEELGNDAEEVLSLAGLPDNGFLALMKGGDGESFLVKFDGKGESVSREAIPSDVFDIIPVGGGNRFMMTGVEAPGRLFLQELTSELKVGEPLYFPESKSFKTDFAFPRVALSTAGEIGVVANTVNDRYPLDIHFQKADESGRMIPLADRTFKYVGNKMITDMVSTIDGGFAITGFWQENSSSLMRILFARIDRSGKGDIQLISSDMNILGCDIENSFQGGFAILRAEVIRSNSKMYEISFTLVDSKGAPTDCANMLPCSIREEDIIRYKPTLIKNEDGYIAAVHGYNGSDYDISLYWIDRTGEILLRYETLRLPGNQFVMDFEKASDGGYVVAGKQKTGENFIPLIIRTDPWGKLNP
jgi:PKD repeat protein